MWDRLPQAELGTQHTFSLQLPDVQYYKQISRELNQIVLRLPTAHNVVHPVRIMLGHDHLSASHPDSVTNDNLRWCERERKTLKFAVRVASCFHIWDCRREVM